MVAKKQPVIRVVDCTDHSVDTPEGTEVTLRGVIHPEDLKFLRTSDYQREELGRSVISRMAKAFGEGSAIPDIELGMRGDDWDVGRNSLVTLTKPTYIIDGFQRVTACLQLMSDDPDAKPQVGAVIHINTTEEWERDRFEILNGTRVKVSPNVLLRNRRHNHPAIDMLHALTFDGSYAFSGRVCWEQRKKTGQILTARLFLMSSAVLHGQFGPSKSNETNALVSNLDNLMAEVGRRRMRDNVKAFGELLDYCWGVRSVQMTERQPHLKSSFLLVLADILASNPKQFWQDKRLVIKADDRRKFAKLPVADPHFANLANSSGTAREELRAIIVRRFNAGRRAGNRISHTSVGQLSPKDFASDDSQAAAS